MGKQDKAGVALIGIGSWSGVIANAVHRSKKARMVTCFTRTPEKRVAFSKKYGCDQEKSFEDVLKRDNHIYQKNQKKLAKKRKERNSSKKNRIKRY